MSKTKNELIEVYGSSVWSRIGHLRGLGTAESKCQICDVVNVRTQDDSDRVEIEEDDDKIKLRKRWIAQRNVQKIGLKKIYRFGMRWSRRLIFHGECGATKSVRINWIRDHVNQIDGWLKKYAGAASGIILDFCKTHDILNELKHAVYLAENCFRPSAIHLEVDVDPETDDRNIVISLTISNRSRQEVLAAYRDVRNQLIKALPRAKSQFIRLSYDIL